MINNVKSMTGYGSVKVQTTNVDLEIMIRSVNGRFLEIKFHIPREYLSLEGEMRKLLAEFFTRGSVDIFISRKIKADGAKGSRIKVNSSLAQEYLSAFRSLGKKISLSPDIVFRDLLRLPDLIQVEINNQVTHLENKKLILAFKKACSNCQAERNREGQSLFADLSQLLKQLHDQLEVIESFRQEANQLLQEKYHDKIKARLKESFKDVSLDNSRLAQEIVIQLEKSDLSEEVSRLREHIKNFEVLLKCKVVQGKKLDFYTQELLREVNTIGSKSQLTQITQSVVEAKTIVERIREQVQNIE